MEFYNEPGEYDSINYVPKQESHGTKILMRVFYILLLITIVDFLIYFYWPQGGVRNAVFILLGLVKAYFIVGTFMHMKYEKINLAAIILVPTLFIIFFVGWMLQEGNEIQESKAIKVEKVEAAKPKP